MIGQAGWKKESQSELPFLGVCISRQWRFLLPQQKNLRCTKLGMMPHPCGSRSSHSLSDGRTTRVEEETVAKRRRVGPWWRLGCTHISTDDEVEKECMKTPTCAANCTDSSKPTARKGSTA